MPDDRAAGGIAAIQCILRTSQQLNALSVENSDCADVRRNHRHIVDVGSDRLLAGKVHVVCPYTTNGDTGIPPRIAVRANVGKCVFQLVRPQDIKHIELLGSHGTDRDRHVLRRLFTFLRGYDDLLELRGRRNRYNECAKKRYNSG